MQFQVHKFVVPAEIGLDLLEGTLIYDIDESARLEDTVKMSGEPFGNGFNSWKDRPWTIVVVLQMPQ
jgi:hypothetical protein